MLAAALDSLDCITLILDGSGCCVFASASGQRGASEWQGLHHEELYATRGFDADSQRRIGDALRALVSCAGEASELRDEFCLRDGETLRWLRLRARRIHADQQDYVVISEEPIDELRRLQAECEKYAARQEDSQEVTGTGSYELDLTTKQIEWSKQFFRILKRDPALGVMPEHEYVAMIHPQDRERVLALWRAMHAGVGTVDATYRLQISGHDIHVHNRCRLIVDPTTGRKKVVGTVLDVTAQRETEERLLASEAHYRRIVETADEGIWLTDAQWRTTYVNRKLAETLHETPESMQGRYILEFRDPQHLDSSLKVMAHRRAGVRDRREVELLRKDGSKLWVIMSSSPVFDENTGEFQGALAMVTDITMRKSVEEALAARELRLSEAERIARIGSWELDPSTMKLIPSPELRSILRLPAEETQTVQTLPWMEGQGIERYFHIVDPEEKATLRRFLATLMAGGVPGPVDFHVRHLDGSMVVLRTDGRAFADESGKVVRVIGATQDVTAQKRAEYELADRERLLRGLFDHAPIGIQVFGPDGSALRTNAAQRTLLGLPSEGHEPAAFNILRDPFSVENGSSSSFLEALTGKVIVMPGQRLELKSGAQPGEPQSGPKVLDVLYFPLMDKSGKVTAVVQMMRDISARWSAEEALRMSEERLRLAHLAEGIGYWDLDVTTGMIVVSPEWATIFGLAPQTHSGPAADFIGFVYPEDMPRIQATILGALRLESEGGKERFSLEHRTQTSSGELRWIAQLCKVFRDPAGNALRVVATVRDITVRKSVAEERQKFFDLVENSVDCILMTTLSGELTYLNPAGRRLIGLSADAPLTGLTLCNDGVSPKLRFQDQVAPCLRKDGRWAGENALRHQQTSEDIAARMSIFEVRDPIAKTPLCIAVIAQDIREAKRAEEALRSAKESAEAASRAKSGFVANVSHELRTPMNGVLGMLEVALLCESDAGQRERLRTAKASAEALLALLDDLLDLSKMEAGRLELMPTEFSLTQKLTKVADLFQFQARKKGLQLHLESDLGFVDRIVADKVRVRQVLINLLSNAIKFTARGEVGVRCRLTPISDGEYSLYIEVRDTGIGIEPEVLPRLFQPFEQADSSMTRSAGGTGLGLSIVRQLVTLMKGELGVRSTHHVGSEFWFRIPVRAVASARDAIVREEVMLAGRAKDAISHKGPILVVEDNVVNQMVARELLRVLGYAVDIVSDGLAARVAVSKKSYELILMDLHMPGMDGLTATRNIRADEVGSGRRTPIFALSARAMAGDREECLRAGMDGHLSKPLRIDQLRAAIDALAQKTHQTVPEGAAHLINLDRLLAQIGGDTNLAKQTLAMVAERLPGAQQQLMQAAATRNPQTIRRSAHTLHGMVSNIHPEALTLALSALEKSMIKEQLADLDERMERIVALLNQLQKELPGAVIEMGLRAS